MFMPIDLETGSYARHDLSRALPASRQAAGNRSYRLAAQICPTGFGQLASVRDG
jgi:hypothetical protein